MSNEYEKREEEHHSGASKSRYRERKARRMRGEPMQARKVQPWWIRLLACSARHEDERLGAPPRGDA